MKDCKSHHEGIAPRTAWEEVGYVTPRRRGDSVVWLRASSTSLVEGALIRYREMDCCGGGQAYHYAIFREGKGFDRVDADAMQAMIFDMIVSGNREPALLNTKDQARSALLHLEIMMGSPPIGEGPPATEETIAKLADVIEEFEKKTYPI